MSKRWTIIAGLVLALTMAVVGITVATAQEPTTLLYKDGSLF